MDADADVDRSRLLLSWLQARRALDDLLSELLASGPAGETRVRMQLGEVSGREERARAAFEAYREQARKPSTGPVRPRLSLVEDLADRPDARP